MRHTSGGRQYRAMSLAELARLLQAASRSDWWRLVAEFLEEDRWEPLDRRHQLLSMEPPGTGDERWDVLLAALAEHLAAQDGRGAPAWQGSGKVAVCTNCPNMTVVGIWLRPLGSSRAALGYRSASGAGEEAFGDGSDRLALDLAL